MQKDKQTKKQNPNKLENPFPISRYREHDKRGATSPKGVVGGSDTSGFNVFVNPFRLMQRRGNAGSRYIHRDHEG